MPTCLYNLQILNGIQWSTALLVLIGFICRRKISLGYDARKKKGGSKKKNRWQETMEVKILLGSCMQKLVDKQLRTRSKALENKEDHGLLICVHLQDK